MRVLHVLGSIERSGAETMLLESVPRFHDAGVTMELVATGERPGALARAFEQLGVIVHHAPFAKSLAYFRDLEDLIRVGSYDCVHVHTERAALWVELTATLAGVPRVVRSVHSSFEFTGWLRVRRTAGRWLASRVLGVTQVFVSASVAVNERRRFGTRGICIPNGINVDRFRSAASVDSRAKLRLELGLAPDAVAIVSVGRCIELKQHTHVLFALESLLPLIPQLRYLHVGDGEQLVAEERLANQLGVADFCSFLGERDDVVSILQASDVFIMPSAYEGMGIAALEASACCLPVVAYDVPGLRDVVIDQRTGLLAEPDSDGIALAISLLASDVDLRLAFGFAGRALVTREFALARWIECHVRVYKGVVTE